jgi:Na+-translocating ferredoxin:NAD+ oxidoreductase RnfG subunit
MKLPRLSVHAVVLAILGASFPAHATQYWDKAALIGDFFKGAKTVPHYTRVELTDADAKAIGTTLGTDPPKRVWNFYTAEDDHSRRLGYAVLDSEVGLHEPIDLGVRFDVSGKVDRVEIVEYREAYGDEVRSERFRKQFVGKSAGDPIIAGRDIDIVTGATYSSKSVALGVKRDVLVLQTALKNGSL